MVNSFCLKKIYIQIKEVRHAKLIFNNSTLSSTSNGQYFLL
jgi:hypothetical protein